MLIVANALSELDFSALMEVYIEGNLENGAYFYPEESPERRLELVLRDVADYLRDDFFTKNSAKYYIWTEQGRYISALRLEPCADGLLLEALETRPDCRRRGYGKRLLTSVMESLPKGTAVCSVVAKWNLPSLAIHQACGFCQYLDHCVRPDCTISKDHVTFKRTV